MDAQFRVGTQVNSELGPIGQISVIHTSAFKRICVFKKNISAFYTNIILLEYLVKTGLAENEDAPSEVIKTEFAFFILLSGTK